MDQNDKDKIIEDLTKSENILIVVSQNIGFDGLACGLALYLSLAKLDKNVSIIGKEPIVADAQRLYGVDRVGKTGSSKNPTIVVENAPETVDKVTYFLDNTRLKVVIHPLPGTPQISKDQISIQYTARPADLIFAIGQTSLNDLSSDIAHEQQIDPQSLIINVNNQNVSQKFAQYEFVQSQAVSVSEVCALMIQELVLPIDEDIAYNLYTAIAQSSDNFNPAKTTEQILNIASWLIKFGAGRASLARESKRASFAQDNQQPSSPKLQPQLANYDSLQQTSPLSMGQPKQPTLPPPLPDDFDYFDEIQKPQTKPSSKDWLKPPKIYKGSKSFDGEN